jgi:hypothetical protein
MNYVVLVNTHIKGKKLHKGSVVSDEIMAEGVKEQLLQAGFIAPEQQSEEVAEVSAEAEEAPAEKPKKGKKA